MKSLVIKVFKMASERENGIESKRPLFRAKKSLGIAFVAIRVRFLN
jgi:hypothetical protein